MEVQNRSAMTRKRKAALLRTMRSFQAEGAILFLIETEKNGLLVAPAYVTGNAEALAGTMREQGVFLPDAFLEDSGIIDVASVVLTECHSAGWLNSDLGSCKARMLSDRMIDSKSGLENSATGVLVLIKPKISMRDSASTKHLIELNATIQSGRDKRFKEAIMNLHHAIVETVAGNEDVAARVPQLVAEELGAKKLDEESCDPRCYSPDELKAPTLNGRKRIDLPGCRDALSHPSIVDLSGDRLVAPVKEISHQLSPHDFRTDAILASQFTQVICTRRNVVFAHKEVPNYLQSYFSAADRQIAGTMFDLVQGFADLDKKQSVASTILEKEKLDGEGNRIEDVFLEPHIEGVWEVLVDLKQDVSLDARSIYGEVDCDKKLLGFVKSFCKDFYFSNSNVEKMQASVQDVNGRTVHLFHMPSLENHAAIYALFYRDQYIPASSYFSIVNRMENIFLSRRREELLHAVSSYMSQARHSVVAYVGMAQGCLEVIQTEWNASLKSEDRWLRMRKNPDYSAQVEQAVWALGHAANIFENGRWLVNEIDNQNIRRTNVDVEEIIENCLNVMQDPRKKKKVVWHRKISGERPVHLYGDSDLLQIALLNLFDNAIKYSPEGGSTIRWELEYGANSWTFSVSNRGSSMESEKLELLKKLGYRGRQKDTLHRRPGTGLGLSVTEKILLAHHPKAELNLNPVIERKGLDGAINTFSFEMPYLTGVEHWPDEDVNTKGAG